MKINRSFCLLGLFLAGFLAFSSTITAQASENMFEEYIHTEQESLELEGFEQETRIETEVAMGMDEFGNIYVVEEEGPTSMKQQGVSMITDDEFFVNFRTKGNTETTDFVEVGTGQKSYLCGKYAADAIYLGRDDDGKILFMLAGVLGAVEPSEVELVPKDAVSYSYYEVVNGNLIHRISTNMYTSGHSSSLRNGPAPEYLKAGVKYYSYDGNYFYTDLDTMVKDYKAGNRNNSVNAKKPFFNYFQYLPFRSYSEYSAHELEVLINSRVSQKSKMRDLGDTIVEMQNKYGVNALLITGIAAIESAYGESSIAMNKNNLFGINAVDATPGQSANYYQNPEQCVKDYMEVHLSRQYFNPTDWKYRGALPGSKASGVNLKYCSDPYWGEKIASVAWLFDAYGGDKDAFLYTIGVKDVICTEHTNLNIRKEPTTSSTSMYKTGKQPCHSFLILDKNPIDGFYKIQSEPVLTAGRESIAKGVGEYDKNKMYLYASSDYITIVSEGSKTNDSTTTFQDVLEDSWYYNSVEGVTKKGIMAGLSKDLFGPYEIVARAQLPVILYRLEGSPAVVYEKKYTDVPNGTWYTNAILWASKNGIVSGYSDHYFGVSDSISREQMASMMYRYAKYKGYNISKDASLNDFSDKNQVSSYAEKALRWMVGSKLLFGKGDGTILDPQGIASRCEAAAIVMRFMEYYNLM